ncbi:MAG: hypothetical protein KDC44_08845, partial [Phaeodactylibacter sp.]|nr:hypothetical protein [Phaeodactylibacter sp.]
MQTPTRKVGIEDISLYIPGQYLPIETLAAERGLDYEKLSKGLGLLKMAVPGLHEDAASMAANALEELIHRNQLNPHRIGRIYIGTESGVDGSKPLASYVLGMLEERQSGGNRCSDRNHCDVVDMTFACIGAVDALQNTLDWVRANPEEIGVVIATDIAKYELASTGEYTQGAGAVALLVKADPALLSIEHCWGVGTQDVHDFFKPLRAFSKETILLEAMDVMGMDRKQLNGHAEHLAQENQPASLLKQSDAEVQVWRETPVFDGPYSNACYQDRIREALQHFQGKAIDRKLLPKGTALTERWASMIFHLPYAFHGKRIASEWFMLELKQQGKWPAFAKENELEELDLKAQKDPKGYGQLLRAVSKTAAYRKLVAEKIERGQRGSSQVGNLYTASIFMALISTLDAAQREALPWTSERLGFIAYGSGS